VKIKNKSTCLITGAAGGIGQALVHVFHNANFSVIATDILPKPAELSCAHYIQFDLAKFTENEPYAQEIISIIRKALCGYQLDALINNAAVQIVGNVGSLSRADWRQTLGVNLMAPFLLTQAFLPELEAASGCIINIGSIHARLTKKDFVAYATSKAALAGMTRALAIELGAHVRINAIEPGAIETDMLKAGFDGKPDLYAQLLKCHPQQRIGQPIEVAQLALSLVEGGANFLHGACLGLDGGMGARLYDPN
jgi:NAD(P)-dependent dehydrogenase (short-subunit alcohol dehydrogenase family)